MKYLDLEGLQYLWAKLKALLAGKADTGHKHSAADITSGTLNAARLADSGATAGTYQKVTVDTKGRVTAGASLLAADIPTLTMAKISDAGTAAKANIGTAAGNVPVLGANGKIDVLMLPSIALTETFPVATQAAMLALTAQPGDVAIRSDISKTYILAAEPATTLANWKEMLSPASPVQSVAGKVGAVTLTKADVGLANADNTADSAKSVSSAATLTTARTVRTNLGSTSAVSFNGSANITPGVTGTLGLTNGGTGATTAAAALTALGGMAAADVVALTSAEIDTILAG
ncbi:hypothetical protein LJC42_06310 [Eubacteriales bacterium OttesenSCG-928-K08]|nr:hypothetical protein [Eubacteriales bacterium OttesenSCG-928-K08]